MLLLGIDIGTSSIKVSVVDAETNRKLASASYPETEAEIHSVYPGWAEQDPNLWWDYTCRAIRKANMSGQYKSKDIAAIGIAYQMHGLVLVDKQREVLRRSIIWCDSRAVEIGDKAAADLEPLGFLSSHLNSPGNFTASKLAWVKQNEPEVYQRVYKFMLPGDFIAMKLTGEINTNQSSLSEGILWNFQTDQLSSELLDYYHIDKDLVPEIKPVFSTYGKITKQIANDLGLSESAVVSYKAGDQPNNALSLNVFQPGEVAATAGTSGVIYAVTDKLASDPFSRVNTFAHVNHSEQQRNLGVLLCINGTGIQNNWARQIAANELSYPEINQLASSAPLGSGGLIVLPFGNGAERMLRNKLVGSNIENIDLVSHSKAHLLRAVQEGIAMAFRYGLDILRSGGIAPSLIRASYANMFLSPIFAEAFAGVTGTPLELYENEGSVGAAIGAGLGIGYFSSREQAFAGLKIHHSVEPKDTDRYDEIYGKWKQALENKLKI